MNEEDRIEISVNQEDVQNIINAYEKDLKYIEQLEQERNNYKELYEKKLDEIVFSEDSLKKYQHEINEFRKICDDLMNDKSIKKAHKKYLEKKEEINYKNNWNELKEWIKEYPVIHYSSMEKVNGIRLSGKLIREDNLLEKMEDLERL